MELLLVVPATLLGVVALLLALPVEVCFTVSRPALDAPIEKSGRLRWAFGLVDVGLTKRPRVSPRSPPTGQRRHRPRVGRRRRRARLVNVKRLILNPAAWRHVSALLSRLLRAIGWRTLRLSARIGLDDPADTGRLWGAIAPLLLCLPSPRMDLDIQPLFDRTDLILHSEASLRVVPLRLIGILLAFALAPTTWRLLWPALRR